MSAYVTLNYQSSFFFFKVCWVKNNYGEFYYIPRSKRNQEFILCLQKPITEIRVSTKGHSQKPDWRRKMKENGGKTFIYCPCKLGKFQNGAPVSLDWNGAPVSLDWNGVLRCMSRSLHLPEMLPASCLSKSSFHASFSFSSSRSSTFHPLTWRKRNTNTLWATAGGRGLSIQESFCSVIILKT